MFLLCPNVQDPSEPPRAIFILSKIMKILMNNKLKSNLEPKFIRIREGGDITDDDICGLGL